MVLSEGTTEKKSPVTPPGINPGTVRLVAQHLNHYTTRSLLRHNFYMHFVCCIPDLNATKFVNFLNFLMNEEYVKPELEQIILWEF